MSIDVTFPSTYVSQITINNPTKYNAMSRDMMRTLAETWDNLEQSDCRAIVITGEGDKSFSAGADVSGDLSASEETARMVNRALLKTDRFPKPIIAAVNGVCAGGGVELMLSSDIRLACPDARFGLPEVKWGIYPFGGATSKLISQINYVDAMKLLLTAEMVGAEEARRIGLVNEIVPRDGLLGEALRLAELIAKNSPVAVQSVKAHISEGYAQVALSREAEEQAHGDTVRASSDFEEGVAAFREKRTPNYS